MSRKTVYAVIGLLFVLSAQAQQSFEIDLRNLFQIGDFSMSRGDDQGLVIEATDVENKYPEKINGLRDFSINGMIEHLEFHQGKAKVPHDFSEATFLFVKHQNDRGLNTHRLFYITNYDAYGIPLWLLPVALILLAIALSFIKKILFLLAIVLFAGFFWLNGVELGTLWDMFRSVF